MTVHEMVLERVVRDYEVATHRARELEEELRRVREQRDEMQKLCEEMSSYYYAGSHWVDRFIKVTGEIDKEKHEQNG
jgi:hypothetical protein